MSHNARKPILIAGGGLASLLLAQALRRASIPFLIFERDQSISFRAQGYRLRLSSEGLDAIESILEPAEFGKFWDACGKTGGTGMTTLDAITGLENSPSTKPMPGAADTKPNPPGTLPGLQSRGGKVVGISRGDMRKFFMHGCEPFVQWAHHVTGYELTPSGIHAIFRDGSKSVEGEMLVGGEGIHSTVAKQLSRGKLKVYDTGARGIHGQAPSTAFKGLGEGVWQLTDRSKPGGQVSVITNVRSGDLNDPTVQFGWAIGAQPGMIQVPNDDDAFIGKPAAEIAKSLTAGWHPRLRPLFEQMDDSEAAFWKITCSTPTGIPEWQNEPRVTVIGDAVHSMTPAGGMGANTAMRDSALLGRLLQEAGGYADGLTAAYEKEMKGYASDIVRENYEKARDHFGISIDENSPTV